MQIRPGPIRKTRRFFNDPGHAHELTFTCYRRMKLLDRDRSRNWMVFALEQARRRWEFELWGYVIMPEHVHVLLFPKQHNYDMSMIVKSIKQSVARRAVGWLRLNAPAFLPRLRVRWPNGREEYRFWQQGGGYDRNLFNDRSAWASIQYMHANPVRRELATSEIHWRWSSARWYAGLDDLAIAMDSAPG